jgi:hypothetical protein
MEDLGGGVDVGCGGTPSNRNAIVRLDVMETDSSLRQRL